MSKKIVIGCLVAAAVIGGTSAGAFAYKQYSRYELKQDNVTIELGEQLPENPAEYVSSNAKAVANTKMDFSGVDVTKAGSYDATACYKDQIFPFTVVVEDTTKPKLKLAGDGKFELTEGGTLSGKDIVAAMDDLAGIKRISFSEQQTVNKEEKDMLAAIQLTYDKEGDYTNTCTVEDNNGNTVSADISIHVKADYSKHVSGFQDWVIEAGASGIDFLIGITPDERIASVEPDAETVDLATPGEYDLIYHITGDDNKTIIENQVTVKVVDAQTAQTMANAGETVYVSNNARKEKYVAPAPSTNTAVADSAGASGQEASGSSETAEDNNNGRWWEQPGFTLDFGEHISESPIPGGGTAYGYRTIYIDPTTGEEVYVEE